MGDFNLSQVRLDAERLSVPTKDVEDVADLLHGVGQQQLRLLPLQLGGRGLRTAASKLPA